MPNWVWNALFAKPPLEPQTEAGPPPWAVELARTMSEGFAQAKPDEPPGWATELGELVQKHARAQAKLGARLEALEGKLEAGFSELRAQTKAPAAPRSAQPRPDDLFDAMDTLDAATLTLQGAPGGAAAVEGLQGVLERLQRHLQQAGFTRVAPLGAAPDGKHFRVVGEVASTSLSPGTVAQVVRAAILQQNQLVREGEVLVAKAP
jgi:molecular chaperone GrpE (heat shock protein)